MWNIQCIRNNYIAGVFFEVEMLFESQIVLCHKTKLLQVNVCTSSCLMWNQMIGKSSLPVKLITETVIKINWEDKNQGRN